MAIKKTKEGRMEAAACLRALGEIYKRDKSSLMSRDQVKNFSGNSFGSGHLANLESQGLGIPGGFYLGRRRVYPVDSVVEWLVQRLEV